MDEFLACKVWREKSQSLQVSGVFFLFTPFLYYHLSRPGRSDSVSCSLAMEFVHKSCEKHPRGVIYYLWEGSSNGVTKA